MKHKTTDKCPKALGQKLKWLLANRTSATKAVKERNAASLARAIVLARKLPKRDEDPIARKIRAAIAQGAGTTESYNAVKADFSSDVLETIAGIFAFEPALWNVPFEQFVDRLRRREQSPATDPLRIAVTGSRAVDLARATQQVAIVLHPYLGRQIVWYCGASGMVDEIAAHFLADAGEKVMLVGNRKWSVSSTLETLIHDRKATYVDASVETFLSTLRGTARAKYFLSRTRFAIVFWNGESKGSQKLIESFRLNRNNCLTAFV